jgi:hypothetical protein
MEIKVDAKCIEWIKKLFYHEIFLLLRQEILLSGKCTKRARCMLNIPFR